MVYSEMKLRIQQQERHSPNILFATPNRIVLQPRFQQQYDGKTRIYLKSSTPPLHRAMYLFLLPLLALLSMAAQSISIIARAPAPATPSFDLLFSGYVTLGEKNALRGPLGLRVNVPITSGTFRDPSGHEIGVLVPEASSEHGYISPAGVFYPDVMMTIEWLRDGSFSYLRLMGVGTRGSTSTMYIQMETDAESHYASLNSRFLLGQVTYPTPGSPPLLSVYGLAEPSTKRDSDETVVSLPRTGPAEPVELKTFESVSSGTKQAPLLRYIRNLRAKF